MDRSQKADLVAELKNVFNETSVVVITRNLGLSVAQSTELRLKMRDAGAQFKVAKNRLAKIALEGTKYGSIGEMLTGPTGNMDRKTGKEILALFGQLNGEGRSIIIVTHDPEIAGSAGEVEVLQDGQIVDKINQKGGDKC